MLPLTVPTGQGAQPRPASALWSPMWEDPVISLTSLMGMRESSLRSSLWVVRVLGRMMCNNPLSQEWLPFRNGTHAFCPRFSREQYGTLGKRFGACCLPGTA